MKFFRARYLILIFGMILLTNVRGFAQTQTAKVDSSRYFNPLTDDITKRLPPLEVLIDSAVYNSPTIRQQNLQKEYYTYTELTAKRAWLQNFSFNWGSGYGRYDFWNQDDFIQMGRYYHSWSWRSDAAAMFTISLPLATLVDRRNLINQQKKLIEISMAQKEVNRRALKNEVIQEYYLLVQYQHTIKIYSEYQGFLIMQMQMAQNEFLNGEISISDYNRLKGYQVSGSYQFEKAVSEFNIEYHQLEVTTGMKFNLINTLH